MKINPTNNHSPQIYNTSFKGTPQLSVILSNTSVKNSIPTLSQTVLSQYFDALKLPRINLNSNELKKLFSIEDPGSFLEASLDFLLKKLNISNKIAPTLIYADVNSNFLFGYDRCSNKIIVNTLYEFPSKKEMLVLLRHELQHFLQNIDLYQQEKIKKKHLHNITDIYFKEYTHQLQETLKKSPEKWDVNKKHAKKLHTYKKYLDERNYSAFNKKLNSEKEKIKKALKKFQKDIIKSLGITKAGVPKAKQNERIYQAYIDYKPNKEMSWGEYLTNQSEYDATLAEYFLDSELNNTCFFKFLKEKYQNFINSKDPENIKIQSEMAEILSKNPNINFVLPNSLG